MPTAINAIVIDPRTGNAFVGGHFSSIDNVVAYNIAFYDKGADRWYRLRNRGLVNGTEQAPAHVAALALKDNFLFVGGHFSQTSTQTAGSAPVTGLNNIARFNIGSGNAQDVEHGVWEPMSYDGLDGTVNAMVFSGGDLYVGGSFSSVYEGPTILKNIARYQDATTCSFICWAALPDNGLSGTVWALEISHEFPNNVFVGGEFTNTFIGNRPELSHIARFDRNANAWNELYGNGLNGTVKALKEENRKLYIGGNFTATIGPPALAPTNRLAIYEFPAPFHDWLPVPGDGLSGEVNAIEVKNSVLIAGGTFTQSVNGETLNLGNVAFCDTLNSDEWVVFPGNGFDNSVSALALANGIEIRDLLVGGSFTRTGDGSLLNLQRIAKFPLFIGVGLASSRNSGISSGAWSSLGFNNGNALNGQVDSLVTDPSGNIVVGGQFTADAMGTTQLNRIAKFAPTTRTWSPLANNGLNGQVEALWRVGNDLYVGGMFTATADGAVTNLNRMARYNLTSNTWHSVGNNGLNGNVLSFAQKGIELWVGGSFTGSFDNTVLGLNRLARYNLTAGTWSTVPNNGMNGDVNALAFKGDDLYMGGAFTRTSDNNYFLFFFTRLDTATGTYYELANSGTNLAVERLRLEGNDLYVSGQFTRTKDNTIILDGLGRYDTTLNGWNAVYGYSDVLALGRDVRASVNVGTDLFVGGSFHRVGSTVAHYFTRFYGQTWKVPSGTSEWNDGANWTTGVVPVSNTIVVIPAGAGSVDITSNDVTLNDLMANGGTLTVGAGRTLTINGILKLGGGVIQGDGTVVITNCKRDRIMGGDASSHIRTKLIRCVDNAGVYVFPVGTAQGYAPVFVGEITGTGNLAVQPFEGEYAAPAAGLPANRLRRWWTIENPGGGVTNSQLIFNYSYPDIVSNEATYKAYRISGGTASVASDAANTFTHRATAPNVTAFSDWTIAGDPGGPTPTPTPIPPTPTPTPTPLPIPTPTPTPIPTPTPTPEPTPTPVPTPTPLPTLGTYSNSSIMLSGNTYVTPSAIPAETTSLSATTDSRFRGTLVADPSTGVVRVSNAQPAGLYSIKVTAFGPGGSATAVFDLSVTDGAACTQTVAFTDAADLFPAYFPTSLAIGDIDNDGDQDLAIASETYSTVSIMLGDGTGAFASAGDVGVALGPLATELADINNDGKLDLITANQGSGTISLRLGNGNGTFTPLPNIVFAAGPDSMAVGDMNNDGRRDIVVTFYSTPSVRVLTGDGSGGFTVGPDVAVGSGPRDVVIADVNGDGNGDVLTANGESASVSVRIGDGLGGLSGITEVAVGLTPVSLTVGQFDADSNLDLAVSNNQGASVSIRSGDGLGGFSGATELTAAAFPEALALGDFDNDGVHDIVVGDSATSADIVNFGDGSGGFAETVSVPTGGWPYALRIGDVNGDGRQDLVTGNWFSYQTTVRLGSCYTPTPTPTPTPEPTPTPTPQTNNITVSDNNFTVGSYNTLKEAFDAVNAGTHTGTITMTVNLDTVETAMTNITYSGNGLANYTSITISPAPGAPRVISGLMPDGDALINFNGADNVVIDGINSGGTTLTLANTSTTNFGISSTIRFENGATSNVIRNTSVLGSVNGVSTSVILFYDDAVTTNGNDNNTIENCNIGPYGSNPPSRGIYGLGQSFDANIGNSGNIVNNNNIYDFFNPVGESNGIYLLGGSKFWQITNNRFFQTAPRTGGGQNVIRMDNPNAPNGVEGMTVTGNVIGHSAADGTGSYSLSGTSAFSAIRARIFVGGAATTISNNTITNISLANSSAGLTFYGIHLEQGPFITNNNLIGSLSTTGSITVDFNTTVDVINAGIINFATSSDWIANNNQVGGINVTNANTGGPQVYGIWGFRVSPNSAVLTGNTVGGTVADSINVSGFGNNQQVVGIATNFRSTVSGNTVQNLKTNSGSGAAANASAIGILANNAAVNQTISNNTIRNIRNSRIFATNVVTGIQFTGSTTNTVERNKIVDLLNDSTSTSAEVNGIRVSGGTTVFQNNMVAIGDNIPNAIGTGSTTGGVNGINELGGTNTFYHNSIHIGGDPASGSGPSYAFNSAQTTVVRKYRNNIFCNARSNNGSTGKNYVIRVGGTGIGPTGLTVDNNLYYSTGAGSVFGYYSSADRADISLWQAAIGQDGASIFGDPLFASTLFLVTSDLHIAPTSPAHDAGADLGVTNDFDGDLRPTVTGMDIGADEVLVPTAASVSVGGRVATSGGNGIGATVVTLTNQNGDVIQTFTNPFGYYRFDNVEAGQTYVLTAQHKRFQFTNPTRVISVNSDVLDADFISSP